MSNQSPQRPLRPGASVSAAVPLEEIEKAVESIRYGVVQLIIQDGRIVQIDRTEKIRLA